MGKLRGKLYLEHVETESGGARVMGEVAEAEVWQWERKGKHVE